MVGLLFLTKVAKLLMVLFTSCSFPFLGLAPDAAAAAAVVLIRVAAFTASLYFQTQGYKFDLAVSGRFSGPTFSCAEYALQLAFEADVCFMDGMPHRMSRLFFSHFPAGKLNLWNCW